MPIEHFLNHRVSILRQFPVLDELGEPVLDDYGQPVTTTDTIASVAAGIQPKRATEVAALHQAGAVLSDHKIYLLPRDLTTADHILHDPAECPVPTNDLPEATYNIVATPDAAGAGHHLQVDAKLVENPSPAIAVAAGGDYS